jgi:biotin carboxyl carrier protein
VEQTGKEKFRATVDNEVFEGESVTNDEISAWIVRNSEDTVRAQAKILQSDRVDVWLAGMPFPASVQVVGVAGYAFAPELPAERRIGGEVRALMPGRITSLLVREGESVEAGTPLLILEAMKMQNEITSPIAGRIKSIRVQEGVTVKKDSTLVVVE